MLTEDELDRNEDQLLEYGRRQTKALETIVWILEAFVFLAVLAGVVGAIAYFGS